MKYIYLGMETGEFSTSMLKWHESVYNKGILFLKISIFIHMTKKGGLGCIVRALCPTDRKGGKEDQ